MSSRLAPRTSSTMFWPQIRPVWSRSFRRSTQSGMFLRSFPFRSQVNKCWNRWTSGELLRPTTQRFATLKVAMVIPPLCTLTFPSSCSLMLHTAASALLNHRAERWVIIHQWIDVIIWSTRHWSRTVNRLCTGSRDVRYLGGGIIHVGKSTGSKGNNTRADDEESRDQLDIRKLHRKIRTWTGGKCSCWSQNRTDCCSWTSCPDTPAGSHTTWTANCRRHKCFLAQKHTEINP